MPERMFRICRAYANYDLEVGYMQGMNFIVGAMLLHLSLDNYPDTLYSFGKETTWDSLEEDIFWLFVFINYGRNWREIYKEGTLKVLHLVRLLDQQLTTTNPEVMAHLSDNDIDIQTIAVSFFICLMLNYCPLGLQDKIIDNFLLVGEKLLLEMFPRMMQLCKERILSIHRMDHLFRFLKRDITFEIYRLYKDSQQNLFPSPQTEKFI